MNNQPTSEEKFWAVLSHLSALASGTGMVIPALGWAESRKQPGYAAFQCLQALAYQSLGYTLWAMVYLVVLVVMFIVAPPPMAAAGAGRGTEELGTWITAHIVATVGLLVVYLALPFIGALACLLGRDFRYPILGDRLARYAGYGAGMERNEAHEDSVAASMAHFAIIFPLTGMLVPVALWATQRERSAYMKFQSVQTLVFQGLASLVTLALGVLAMAIVVIALALFLPSLSSGDFPVASLVGAFIFLICLMVILLVVPLFQIVGQWAGLRLLQGHDYHYPVVGRWVEKRLAKRENTNV